MKTVNHSSPFAIRIGVRVWDVARKAIYRQDEYISIQLWFPQASQVAPCDWCAHLPGQLHINDLRPTRRSSDTQNIIIREIHIDSIMRP